MNFLPVIALGVTILLGAAGYYYFRAGRRRTQLRYDIAVERIFTSDGAAEITINGKAVKEPHEVRLWLQPTGVKDIKNDAFPVGEDVVLLLGVPLVTTPTSGDTSLKATGDPGDDQVVIPPQMLKCGPLIYASVIVDGDPRPKFRGELADVDRVKFDVADAGKQSLTGLLRSEPSVAITTVIAIAALVLTAYSIFGAANTKSDQQRIAEAFVESQKNVGIAGGQMGAGGLSVGELTADPDLIKMINQMVEQALNNRGIRSGYSNTYAPSSPPNYNYGPSSPPSNQVIPTVPTAPPSRPPG